MYTYSDELYSDLHKDARGCRPGDSGFSYWNSLTPKEKQIQWDCLVEELDQRFQSEQEEQKVSIEEFEKRVKETIELGAGNRETAIKWIHESMETDGDSEFLCYKLGLPYGYFFE